MADYTQLRNDVWQDPEFEGLPPAAKLLWLNLLTTPVRNTAGLFHYSLGRMAFETGLGRDETQKALDSLIALNWVEYDEPSGVVWVCNFVNRQPGGPKIIPKIRKDVDEGFAADHPLVEHFRIRYPWLYTSDGYPIDTPSIPSARKHSTAQHSTERKEEEGLASLAASEIPSDSNEDSYRAAVRRALDRGLSAKQVESVIYQLADWWPTRPAKAQKRTEAHRTLQAWLLREEPKRDPPAAVSYPDIVVPEDWS